MSYTIKETEKTLIIQFLRSNNGWLSCSYIAEQLKIKPRRIRYLISEISQDGVDILSSNKGYRLKNKHQYQIDNEDYSDVPQSFNERKKYIYNTLVIKNETIDLDDLADYFSVSILTIRNEVEKIKKELISYGIHLKTKQGKLYAVARESNRKSFVRNLIRDELDKTAFSTENIKTYFKHVDLSTVRQIVLGVFTKNQFYIDDYSLLTYIIHLAIRIELSYNSQNQKQHEAKQLNTNHLVDQEIVKIVTEITEQLNQFYTHVNFNTNDISDASLLMTTRVVPNKIDLFEFNNSIEEVMDFEVFSLLRKIITTISDIYSVDLDSEKFSIRFALHIKNLLIRMNNHLSLDSQQFSDIKNTYPFLYVIAVNIAYIIQQETGYHLSEDEIAYITLHVGVILEEKNVQQQKVVCAVLASDYYIIGKNLCSKINQSLGNIIYIEAMTTDVSDLKNHSFDAIISTNEIVYNYNVPIFIVDPFLSEANIDQLRTKVRYLQNEKIKSNSLKSIFHYIQSDFCFFNKGYNNSEEAIINICSSLQEKGLINDTFQEEIFAHEKIAPSSYNNIAIAHTLSNNDISSFVVLSVNKKPVIWGDNKVNLIFLISLKKEERKNFQDLFHSLTTILNDKNAYQAVLETTSFKELESVFKDYL